MSILDGPGDEHPAVYLGLLDGQPYSQGAFASWLKRHYGDMVIVHTDELAERLEVYCAALKRATGV